MKTKIVLILAAVLALSSCSKKENAPMDEPKHQTNGGEEQPVGEKYIRSEHHINRYTRVSDIAILQDVVKPGNDGSLSVLTVAFRTNGIYAYRSSDPNDKKVFDACVAKFGDTGSKMTFPEPLDYGTAVSCRIKGIRIYSNEDYDAEHKKGILLNDIVRIKYHTVYPCISQQYKTTGLDALANPSADESDPSYGVQKIDKTISKLTAKELAMVYFYPEIRLGNANESHPLYELQLTAKPTKPTVQTIRIEIETDEGTLHTTKKVAFM